jgi:hypothetical protein
MANFAAKFQKDLQAGQLGERLVGSELSKILGAVSIKFNNTQSHDFELVLPDGKTQTYEVKADFAAQKTGNIFLEYECSEKPSGLFATQSDKWVILLQHANSFYVFSPTDMMESLLTLKLRQVKGGDGYRARGFLLPVAKLETLSFVQKHTYE